MSVLASERHGPGIKRLRFTSSAAHQEDRQLHVRCVSNCVNYPLMSAPLMSPCPIIRINALFRFGGVLKFCKQNLLLLSYICLLMVLRTSKAGCFLFLSFPTLRTSYIYAYSSQIWIYLYQFRPSNCFLWCW